MQRIYAKSSKAKDCREVVVAFNAAHGDTLENEYQAEEDLPDAVEQENQYDVDYTKNEKWKDFAADEEEEDFTIAAPAVVLKKPKTVTQKRPLGQTSQGAPSNIAKHARAAYGGGDAFQQEEPAFEAAKPAPKAHVPYSMDVFDERGVLPNDRRAPANVQNILKTTVPNTAATASAPPLPQQQVKKKWSSYINTDDAW